jgi:hypothetical protein
MVEIVHDDESAYAINQILIENGAAVYNGELVEARAVTVVAAERVLRRF